MVSCIQEPFKNVFYQHSSGVAWWWTPMTLNLRPEAFRGMRRTLLTPNAHEFRRLCQAAGLGGALAAQSSEMFRE